MTKTKTTLLLLLLLLPTLYLTKTTLKPNHQKQIHKTIQKLAQTATITPNQTTLTRLANHNTLPTLFHTNLHIRIQNQHYTGTLTTKNQIRQTLKQAHATLQNLHIQLTNHNTTLHNNRHATTHTTATIHINNNPKPTTQTLQIKLQRPHKKWLIQQIQPTPTHQP